MDQDNTQLNTEVSASDELTDSLAQGDGKSTAPSKRIRFWDILLWVMIVVLAVAVVVRVFIVSSVTVSGESMTASYYADNPQLTYHNGDTVTVNKVKSPNRGDVVVFYKQPVKSKFLALFARGDSVEQGGEYYKLIKRVVALGGDKLWVESVETGKYRLVIQTPDGTVLHEDYYRKNGETLSIDCFVLSDNSTSGLGCLAGTSEQAPLIVEQGYFFAVGDNRASSDDSRGTLGQVPLSQLFGVVVKN